VKGAVPPVLRLAGSWITVMFPTGKTYSDRWSRRRMVKQAKTASGFAALARGVDPVV